jgi:hypothetical protein
MVENMPASPTLLQIQANMLSSSTIDVRDEIAALLQKMQKEISAEEKAEALINRKTQDGCDSRHRVYRTNIAAAKAVIVAEKKQEQFHHAIQQGIPAKVLAKEARIRKIKVDIGAAEVAIASKQKERDDARDAYLSAMADFNKALDDIDMLRVLVETGLSNRGQGADKNDDRSTQSPTKKGYTYPPTKAGYDRKATHGKTDAGKFLEITSTEQLASMSRSEAVETMKNIYSNLRSSVGTNHMVLAVVDTLDSAMAEVENGDSAVDKIRDLLIQVRNELQKSKREMTAAENEAINNWKSTKIRMRNEINDFKISWQGIYKEIAQLWKQYGDEFQAEGQAMLKQAIAKQKQDNNQINLDFETVVCDDQERDYKQQSAKRYGQLAQIKKVLDLLSKMGLSGKYGEAVRDSIKDINAGLCRAFDDNSTWVSVDPTDYRYSGTRGVKSTSGFHEDAWKIYPNKAANGNKFVCVSAVQYTITTTGAVSKIMVNIPGPPGPKWTALPAPGASYIGKEFKITQRLAVPMEWKSVQLGVMQGKGVTTTRNDVSIFVIPGCNCDKSLDPALKVTHNQAKTNDQKKAAVPDKAGTTTKAGF